MTVRLDAQGEFMQLFLSQHGTGQWVSAEQLQWEGTHPVIYPSLHSHANLNAQGVRPQANLPISGIRFVSSINWIKFVDVTTLEATLRYDWMANRETSVVWRTWKPINLRLYQAKKTGCVLKAIGANLWIILRLKNRQQ